MENRLIFNGVPVQEDEVDSDAETEVNEDLPGLVDDVSDDPGYSSDTPSEIGGEELARIWFGLHSRIDEANLGSRGSRIRSLYVDEELCLARFRHAANLPAGRHLFDLDFVPQIREEGFLFMDSLLVLLGDLSSDEMMWIFGQLPWRDFRSDNSLLLRLVYMGSNLRESYPGAPGRILDVLEWFIRLLESNDDV
ncbi:hypothetical protein KQX54_007604 [Cotesia glomerata]|uniref:Uncharacterized protein n=1 Tax=Cotesia glomerata TaxID=32391 RepID=A0AAV7IV59_COTGL|nr:hypothetical protein KQX54_007604 [Cotesia glomerata]